MGKHWLEPDESIQGLSVTIQQGVPRGLAGPLAGRGVSPPFTSTPPPEAAQEKGDLNSHGYQNSEQYAIISEVLYIHPCLSAM